MQSKTLVSQVSKIIGRKVTDKEAQIFASEQYGVLATFIRNEFIDSLQSDKLFRAKKRVFGTVSKKFNK